MVTAQVFSLVYTCAMSFSYSAVIWTLASCPQQNRSWPLFIAHTCSGPTLTESISLTCAPSGIGVCVLSLLPQHPIFPALTAQVCLRLALTAVARKYWLGTVTCPHWLLPQHVSMRLDIAHVLMYPRLMLPISSPKLEGMSDWPWRFEPQQPSLPPYFTKYSCLIAHEWNKPESTLNTESLKDSGTLVV